MAERTAAVTIPENKGPNVRSLAKNKIVSGLSTDDHITFAQSPSVIIPENIIVAHTMAMIRPILMAFRSLVAINRLTTKGCPG